MNKQLSKDGKEKLKNILNKGKSKIKKVFPMDTTLFILQFLRHPNDIGAITPSSEHLAEAMTRYIKPDTENKLGKRYLEAGAGTGAFTKTIINKLSPNDHLDIIEINPLFCERLQKKYSEHPNVTIHAGSVLDWNPGYKYDVIVSSLPFTAFRANFLEEIFNHYEFLSKPKGIVTYCEYMALPGIRKMFLPQNKKRSLQQTLDITYRFQKKYQVSVDKVFANLPPALVHHCQFE